MIAAYRYAGKPVTVRVRGIEVLRLIDGSGGLEELDPMTQIDRQPVRSVEQLTGYLSRKKAGGEGSCPCRPPTNPPGPSGPIDFPGRQRKGKEKARLWHCARFKNPKFKPILLSGLTVQKSDAFSRVDVFPGGVKPVDAGDFTGGYRIAGTGTISPDGQVGQIGGIEYKITGAAEKGAHFLPRRQNPC